ncbi:RING type zinc finger Zinc finger C3HC4 type (RING finger) [Trypanosoma vivax]|nr:RING type zinc finger Zinc finger C3HC4 type (RING finger) [Trypanosoma vivax]
MHLCDSVEVKGGVDEAVLNERVLSQLQELLRCPMCGEALLHDPTAIDTCGHTFCYECINNGVGYGYYPVSSNLEEEEKPQDPDTKQEPGTTDGGGSGNARANSNRRGKKDSSLTPGKGKEKRPRKMMFSCPVCLVPAHKWNLVRVPLISDVVIEAMSKETLREALKSSNGMKRFETVVPRSKRGRSKKGTVAVSNEEAPAPLAAELEEEVAVPPPNAPPSVVVDEQVANEEEVVEGDDHSSRPNFTDVVDAAQSVSVTIIEDSKADTQEPDNVVVVSDAIVTVPAANTGNHNPLSPSPWSVDLSFSAEGGQRSAARREQEGRAVSNSSDSSVARVANWMVLNEESVDGDSAVEGGRASDESLELSDSDLSSVHSADYYNSNSNYHYNYHHHHHQQQQQHPGIPVPLHYTLAVDGSVPTTAGTDDILLTSMRLFRPCIFDERCRGGSGIFSNDWAQPVLALRHDLLPVTGSHRAPTETRRFYWRELHYAASPMTFTHCLVVLPESERNYAATGERKRGDNTLSPTPSIATALVTGATLVDIKWIEDCVATRCLLPALPYSVENPMIGCTAASGGCERGDCGGRRAAQWVQEGYAFLPIPDAVLKRLQEGGQTVVKEENPKRSRRAEVPVTGGFDTSCWGRLLLLSGGVLLQLDGKWLDALVEYVLSREHICNSGEESGADRRSSARQRGGSGRSVEMDEVRRFAESFAERHRCLWRVARCPERELMGGAAVGCVVVLRGSFSEKDSISGSPALFKRRIECLFQVLKCLLSIFPIRDSNGCNEATGTSQHSPSGSPAPSLPGRAPFVFGNASTNGSMPSIKMRSTKWLLHNISKGNLSDSSN